MAFKKVRLNRPSPPVSRIEIVPRKYKDKARQKVVDEINDEFTNDKRKNLLIKQLKIYDKLMGYK